MSDYLSPEAIEELTAWILARCVSASPPPKRAKLADIHKEAPTPESTFVPHHTNMAPFRPSGGRNRGNRAQNDEALLEGLPVRQWRKRPTFIDQDAVAEEGGQKAPDEDDKWTRELPMPRESHMYPEHSQQLLRAARAGKTLLQRVPPPDDDPDAEGDIDYGEFGANGAAGAGVKEPRGFYIERYVRLPKDKEEPEPEYLAPRRPGLAPLYMPSGEGGPVYEQVVPGPVQGPMRKTKVRKADQTGAVSVWEVWVPQGHTVEGEVVEDVVMEGVKAAPAEATPGTVVDGVGIVNTEGVLVAGEAVATPPRRKPPIPRKKHKKGPGRGKKKVAFTDGAEGPNGGLQPGQGAAGDASLDNPAARMDGGGDTPMADAHEGDEDDDDEGDEGEEGDEEDGHDEAQPATVDQYQEALKQHTTPPATTAEPSIAVDSVPDTDNGASRAIEITAEHMPNQAMDTGADTTLLEPPPAPVGRDPSSSPELPLSAAVSHSRHSSQNQVPTLADLVPGAESEAAVTATTTETANVAAPVDNPTTVIQTDTPGVAMPMDVSEATDVVMLETEEIGPTADAEYDRKEEPAPVTDVKPTVEALQPAPDTVEHHQAEADPMDTEVKVEEDVPHPAEGGGDTDLFGSLEAHLNNESKT